MPSANEYSLPYAFMQYACDTAAATTTNERQQQSDDGGKSLIYNMNAIQVSLCATLFLHIYVFTSEHKTHLIWQTTTVGGRSQKHPSRSRCPFAFIHPVSEPYVREIVVVVMASTAMRNKWKSENTSMRIESHWWLKRIGLFLCWLLCRAAVAEQRRRAQQQNDKICETKQMKNRT